MNHLRPGRQKWIASKDIEGLDAPMIFPVPEGFVQDWDTNYKRYKLRKKKLSPTPGRYFDDSKYHGVNQTNL